MVGATEISRQLRRPVKVIWSREEDIANDSLAAIPAKRFGQPDEFGELCAFICSAQASYITGQNFLIDGGAYPGTY